MSDSLIIRKRLHRFILTRCKHWGLKRQRIPRAFIKTLEDDLQKQVDARIMGLLTPPDPLPKEPKPRAPKPPGKRCLKHHPSLF